MSCDNIYFQNKNSVITFSFYVEKVYHYSCKTSILDQYSVIKA